MKTEAPRTPRSPSSHEPFESASANTAPDMMPRRVNIPSTMRTEAVAGPSETRSPVSVTPLTRAELTSLPVSWPALTRARKTISRLSPGCEPSETPREIVPGYPRHEASPREARGPGTAFPMTTTLSSAVSSVTFSTVAMKLRTSPTSAAGSRIDCSIETIGMLDLTSTSSTRSLDSSKKIEAASTANASCLPANLLNPSAVDCSRKPTTVERPLGIVPAVARYVRLARKGRPGRIDEIDLPFGGNDRRIGDGNAHAVVEVAAIQDLVPERIRIAASVDVHDDAVVGAPRRGLRISPGTDRDASSRGRCARRPRSIRDDTAARPLPRNRRPRFRADPPRPFRPSRARGTTDRLPRRERDRRQQTNALDAIDGRHARDPARRPRVVVFESPAAVEVAEARHVVRLLRHCRPRPRAPRARPPSPRAPRRS